MDIYIFLMSVENWGVLAGVGGRGEGGKWGWGVGGGGFLGYFLTGQC